jgi:hypothetical protein
MRNLIKIITIVLSLASFVLGMYLFYCMFSLKPLKPNESAFLNGAWWSIKIMLCFFMAFSGWMYVGEKIHKKLF